MQRKQRPKARRLTGLKDVRIFLKNRKTDDKSNTKNILIPNNSTMGIIHQEEMEVKTKQGVHHNRATRSSDGPFALRKVEAGLYGVLKSEFQTHEVGIVPNF